MIDNAALLKKAKKGDIAARDELITGNLGLVHSIAQRFLGRGYDLEELCQIGAVGLIKAVDRFNPDFDVRFSTYAVPVIMGEIRKFLRDDGPVKVSRGLKELSVRAASERQRFENTNGRQPTVSELAEILDVELDRLLMAMESAQSMQSLYESTDAEGENLLLDKIPAKTSSEETTIEQMALSEALGLLSGREKTVIIMRYYRNKTQSQTAQLLGVSQVQVSRIESKAREKLRLYMG